MRPPKIIVAIPAYNAAKTVSGVIRRIPKRSYSEVLVVDDGSRDDTYAVAKKIATAAIRHGKNRGYGAAQKTLFHEALRRKCDVVVLLHADGQHDPSEISSLTRPILDGKADVVIGSRILGNPLKGGMPLHRFLGNRALTFLENAVFGVHISDYHTGYRAYSRKALKKINFSKNSDRFDFDSEILVQCIINGFRIAEVPVSTHYRSEKSALNPFSYGMNVMSVLLEYILHKSGLKKSPKY